MPSTWNLLEGFQIPLLLKGEFGASNYSIWLTDLTNLWMERMERRPIIKRAFEIEDLSIDPSEGSSQMDLLLSSIQKSLACEAGTRIDISSNDEGKTLVLSLSVPLPSSLPDLQWKSTLSKCPPSSLTRELVLPLLAAGNSFQARNDSLLTQVKEKDVIISKLIGQMQVDGSDLSKVFPGSASFKATNKSNARQALARSVKGIAEFDEQAWDSQMQQVAAREADSGTLLAKMCPLEITDFLGPYDFQDKNALWWASPRPPMSIRQKEVVNKNGIQPEDKLETTFESSKYESQPYAPESNAKVPANGESSSPLKKPSALHTAADESTTDETDDDLPMSFARLPSRNHTPLGQESTLEDRVDAKASTSPTGQSQVKTSQDEELAAHSEVSRPRPRLGKIGGKKREPQVVSLTQDEQAISSGADRIVESSEIQNKTPSAHDNTSRGRASSRQESNSPNRETSLERANKNREKLKRELDSRGKSGTKKKRKF